MKIRIQGSSLRLRLSEAEVQQFGAGKSAEETIVFGPEEKDKLTFILTDAIEKNEVDILFKDNIISVQIPTSQILIWQNSNQASILAKIPNGKPEGLKILIEKDLDCSHNKGNDSWFDFSALFLS